MSRSSLRVEGTELSELVARIVERAGDRRLLLGLAGPPGVGKSTLAAALAERVGGVVVPLDGFHLADVELERQRLLHRKGAPGTFDAWGYAALLRRLRCGADHVVYAPAFDRMLEQPLAGAIPVAPDTQVVLTEGNYLLLDRPEWRAGREQLDEVWYVDGEPGVRVQRLVARHVAFGKSDDEARRWVEEVDAPNAVLVAGSSARADVVVDLSRWRRGGGDQRK